MKGFNCAFSLVFLDETDDGVEQNYREDDCGVGCFIEYICECACDDQDDDHEVEKFSEELERPRSFRFGLDYIGAVFEFVFERLLVC